ncbi:hypothetical protein DSO57_1012099 [Entomophthora muscae]|uniref:Uncharacterized protein n=1 Tax=Entomophthora muscae TaxID=34485 RepID=A0ACC2SIY4_9FUNG|nr:hypothetical protein DSO57_1012099 [Entomophthora muscae]
MNYLIFTAVLTACLGIGGYQQGLEFFGPSPDGLVHDPYYNPSQLNSFQTGPWPPLVSPHLTLSIAMYISAYYVLTYFARSLGRYNVHTKVFCWLMTVYPIVTALNGFQFANLLPYILQVIPTVLSITHARPGGWLGVQIPQWALGAAHAFTWWPGVGVQTLFQARKAGPYINSLFLR